MHFHRDLVPAIAFHSVRVVVAVFVDGCRAVGGCRVVGGCACWWLRLLVPPLLPSALLHSLTHPHLPLHVQYKKRLEEPAVSEHEALQRVDRIQQQVDHDLLDLDSVGMDPGQCLGIPDVDGYLILLQTRT